MTFVTSSRAAVSDGPSLRTRPSARSGEHDRARAVGDHVRPYPARPAVGKIGVAREARQDVDRRLAQISHDASPVSALRAAGLQPPELRPRDRRGRRCTRLRARRRSSSSRPRPVAAHAPYASAVDFDLTDEQQLVRETARAFTDNEIVAARARERPREHFDRELVAKLAARATSARSCRASTAARASTTYLRAARRGDRARRQRDADGRLRPDLARLRRRSCAGAARSRSSATCPAVLRRVAGLLRPDRAGRRLGRREPEHARAARRRRLAAQRGEDVDLARQPREGRADLRPDRSGAGAPRPRVLSRRHRPARLPAAEIHGKMGLHGPTPRRSRSTTSSSPTTTCSARSATASRSR